MWKAKKNIWREIQIPSPSRLMDEQAPPVLFFALFHQVGISLLGRYWKAARCMALGGGGVSLRKGLRLGQQSQLRLLLLCPVHSHQELVSLL